MSNTTIRDLCAALAGDVDYLIDCVQDNSFDPVGLQECANHMHTARDLLAAEPVGEGPSNEELIKSVMWMLDEVVYENDQGEIVRSLRELIARWGRPAAPPAPAAEPVGEGPSKRIVSVAKAVQECAFAHESDARLIGNVCAEDVADLCAAVLACQGRPAASTITVDDWFTVAMVAQDMQARGLAEQACGQDLLKLANSNRSQSAHPSTPATPETTQPIQEDSNG